MLETQPGKDVFSEKIKGIKAYICGMTSNGKYPIDRLFTKPLDGSTSELIAFVQGMVVILGLTEEEQIRAFEEAGIAPLMEYQRNWVLNPYPKIKVGTKLINVRTGIVRTVTEFDGRTFVLDDIAAVGTINDIGEGPVRKRNNYIYKIAE